MPKKGGPGSRKSVRVEEKAALEAEQAAAVVDAQAAAKAVGCPPASSWSWRTPVSLLWKQWVMISPACICCSMSAPPKSGVGCGRW